MLYNRLVELIGNTPLVEMPSLSPRPGIRFFAKLEGQNPSGSLKDRIALYMVEGAEERGQLRAGMAILEATSGNTGVSLAMIARIKGYPIKVVMPDSVSIERTLVMRAFGADVIHTEGAKYTDGAIDLANRMADDDSSYFLTSQFDNADNPLAHYETTGPEILRDLPDVDAFIAGTGTGGTLAGVGRYLKERRPEAKVICVEPKPGDLIEGLHTLEGFSPGVFDDTVVDEHAVVATDDAFAATREMARSEGIFAGVSAGAVLCAARALAERVERGNFVLLVGDGGWKYLSTGVWAPAAGRVD
ncbi:MAG: cysteine synthase family protein [Dehalococcoidia bacterium]|nr:cysteine synthase family protein [Dehalococcoidia bacterium]